MFTHFTSLQLLGCTMKHFNSSPYSSQAFEIKLAHGIIPTLKPSIGNQIGTCAIEHPEKRSRQRPSGHKSCRTLYSAVQLSFGFLFVTCGSKVEACDSKPVVSLAHVWLRTPTA